MHPQLQEALLELSHLGAVEVADEMAIVSLVGQGMKNMVGVSGKMLKALGDSGINVEMISQGKSYRTSFRAIHYNYKGTYGCENQVLMDNRG